MPSSPNSIIWYTFDLLQSFVYLQQHVGINTPIMRSINRDSLLHNIFSLSWLSGWKPMYLLRPSKSAECKVIPSILNAATPVGEVSNHLVQRRLTTSKTSTYQNGSTLWHLICQHHQCHWGNMIWLNMLFLFQCYHSLFAPVTMEHDYWSLLLI